MLLRNHLLFQYCMPQIVSINCSLFLEISETLSALLLGSYYFLDLQISQPHRLLLPQSISQQRAPCLCEVRASAPGNLLNQIDQRPQKSTVEREQDNWEGRICVEGGVRIEELVYLLKKNTLILRKYTGVITHRLGKWPLL